MELTGLQNPMVKAAAELKQKKYRQQQGLFLAEGLRTVEEAVRYGAVQSIFYTAIEDDRTRAVLEQAAAKQIKLICVSDKVLKKIADTETPQGIIAVCEMRSKRLDDFLASGKMLLFWTALRTREISAPCCVQRMPQVLAAFCCCRAALIFMRRNQCVLPWARCSTCRC